MRILIVSMILMAGLTASAMAQGYTYQPSGLEFQTTVPVEAGQSVKGLILLPGGMTGLGDIYVEGTYTDDLFTYWEGTYNGGYYYYDIYSCYWKPGPISYLRANLDFQGTNIEGWIRGFGSYYDADHFFGQDGVLYQRINITRNRTRNTSRRRQIIYSYFVNMQTLERSDSGAPAYRYIGQEPDIIFQSQIEAQETRLDEIIKDDPAYPQWELEAFDAPSQVVTPDGIPSDSPSLLQMIEGEIGPLHEGDAVTVESN